MSRLDRFKTAQASSHAGLASALAEIRSGGKTGHWIWYVFPQIEGLGTSGTSQAFAIDGEDEAEEYLRDPELRTHFLSITTAVAEQLRTAEGPTLDALMGSAIDARKVVSSLTLFGHVARKLHAAESLEEYDAIASVADEVLAVAAAQGYPRCAYTLKRLGRWA
jgi:uncharacterized protein (DUF1810 family)